MTQWISPLELRPLQTGAALRHLAVAAIRYAINTMDLYQHPRDIRLEERKLGQDLGISRTPIREALRSLEQEGLVRSVPRRGVFVVRKNKAELVDMTLVWAAIRWMQSDTPAMATVGGVAS